MTLAVFPVEKGIKMVEYLRKCVEVIRKLNVNVEVLCLDRGFYSKKVLLFLQNEGIPHIMPVKKYGAKMNTLLIGNCAR